MVSDAISRFVRRSARPPHFRVRSRQLSVTVFQGWAKRLSRTYAPLSLRRFAPIIAVIASFLVMWLVCIRLHIDASPAILSAALALALARDPRRLTYRGFVRTLVSLPVVALAAGAVGAAFEFSLLLGGVLFCICVSLSVWLRRFGPLARAFSRIIALPFVAMLVVPVRIHASGAAAAGIVVAAGVTAVICTALVQLLLPSPVRSAPARAERRNKSGIDPHARMALQMFVALVLAFVVGALILPEHWFWVVLTAFIVCSGAVARGDAIYKALLRLGGAVAGTFAAALLALLPSFPGPVRAATIFAVLAFAIPLRERNYAYWAAGATLIFALLRGNGGESTLMLFSERVLGIAIGALCAIAATWFVMPLRTEQIIRRRIADVMAAYKRGDADALHHHLRELERAPAPMVLHRRIFRRWDDDRHPAAMVERTREFVLAPANRVALMTREVAVYISVAMTIDGYIDDRSAQRLVLSNENDMSDVRDERSRCDAVLVGAGTVRADNPSLRAAPIRVTITRSGNLDPQSRFFEPNARTIVLAAPEAEEKLQERLGERAEVHAQADFSPDRILQTLHRLGIRSLFVEGGTRVLTDFLSAGAFDRLRLAIAPFFAGERGGARIVDPASFPEGAQHRLVLREARMLGDMAVLEYERQRE